MWEEGGKRYACVLQKGKDEKKFKNLMQKCTYNELFLTEKPYRVGGGGGMECGDFGCESHEEGLPTGN
jgi:hypothetical protein